MWIDLGDVKNLAEVTVNGKSLGIVWHAPYRVDATERAEAGRERSDDQGDQCLGQPADRRSATRRTTKYTFADVKPYKANSPLLASGLLGPVEIYHRNDAAVT